MVEASSQEEIATLMLHHSQNCKKSGKASLNHPFLLSRSDRQLKCHYETHKFLTDDCKNISALKNLLSLFKGKVEQFPVLTLWNSNDGFPIEYNEVPAVTFKILEPTVDDDEKLQKVLKTQF